MRTHNCGERAGIEQREKVGCARLAIDCKRAAEFASIVTYARDNNLDDASVVAEFAAIFREIENMSDFQPNMRPAR